MLNEKEQFEKTLQDRDHSFHKFFDQSRDVFRGIQPLIIQVFQISSNHPARVTVPLLEFVRSKNRGRIEIHQSSGTKLGNYATSNFRFGANRSPVLPAIQHFLDFYQGLRSTEIQK